MAKEKKKNIFQRIAQLFKDVRLELKRVVWPTTEKLKSVSAVVLVVIVFFAIFLSVISMGGHWALEKVGFYDQVARTEATEVIPSDAAPSPVSPADEVSEEASNG